MCEITNKHQAGYEAESIVEKFDWLTAEQQGEWEAKFAEELRDDMEQKEFANIVLQIVNWSANDLHGSIDRRWEDFLARTEPQWRHIAIERYAEHHDWLDDEDREEKTAAATKTLKEAWQQWPRQIDPEPLPKGFVDQDHDGLG